MKKHDIDWLKKNGFDGLYYGTECACCVDDLNPCGEDCIEDCVPGF